MYVRQALYTTLVFGIIYQLRTCAETTKEVTQMMAMLGLTDKRNAQARTLSGGIKRKLSVGIALIGNPQVSQIQRGN